MIFSIAITACVLAATVGAASDGPSARFGHSQVSISNGDMVVFGGFAAGSDPVITEGTKAFGWSHYNGLLNDAWLFKRGACVTPGAALPFASYPVSDLPFRPLSLSLGRPLTR